MFEMLDVMSAGHLLELMIQLCYSLTSQILPGVICVAMVTSVIAIPCTNSALLATALFDREANCRKAASVSRSVMMTLMM